MKYLVIGAGGVGAFIGAKLVQAGEEVWFVARGKHLASMKSNGLRVRSGAEEVIVPPQTITGSPSDAGDVDVVLLCVKTYDTESSAALIRPVVKNHAIVLSFQNGIESVDTLSSLIPEARVIGGAAYVSSRIIEPGVVHETGGVYRFLFGSSDEAAFVQGKAVEQSFRNAGLNPSYTHDMYSELWRKLIFIASMGTFTAVSRLSYGEILSADAALRVVFAAMREAEQVAVADGARIEPFVEAQLLSALRRFDPNTRSSLYYDLMNSKPLELEALNGVIIRKATTLEIPTPVHSVLYGSLLPYSLRQSSTPSP